jgi:hypothetical protein
VEGIPLPPFFVLWHYRAAPSGSGHPSNQAFSRLLTRARPASNPGWRRPSASASAPSTSAWLSDLDPSTGRTMMRGYAPEGAAHGANDEMSSVDALGCSGVAVLLCLAGGSHRPRLHRASRVSLTFMRTRRRRRGCSTSSAIRRYPGGPDRQDLRHAGDSAQGTHDRDCFLGLPGVSGLSRASRSSAASS